jgi:hypothetical protein
MMGFGTKTGMRGSESGQQEEPGQENGSSWKVVLRVHPVLAH